MTSYVGPKCLRVTVAAGQEQASILSTHLLLAVSTDPPKQHIEYTPNGVQYLILLRVLLAEGQYH